MLCPQLGSPSLEKTMNFEDLNSSFEMRQVVCHGGGEV